MATKQTDPQLRLHTVPSYHAVKIKPSIPIRRSICCCEQHISNMAKSAPKKEMKVKRRRGPATFNSYIFKVMKQVHPETRISKKGMTIINNFVTDTFEKVALEASKLCRIHKRGTISSRDVQSAVRLVLPGELSKHAVSEGTKAMTKFSQA